MLDLCLHLSADGQERVDTPNDFRLFVDRWQRDQQIAALSQGDVRLPSGSTRDEFFVIEEGA